MALFKSGNPALTQNTFENLPQVGSDSNNVMTLQGTVNKTMILLALVIVSAIYTWDMFNASTNLAANAAAVKPWMWGGLIGGLVVALAICFKKTWAPYLSPVYAVLEGLFLGAISAMFNAQFPGIVLNAVLLTLGICAGLLFLYKTRLIKPTENFKLMVASATLGIMVVYLITFALQLFGVSVSFMHDSSWLSIGISLFVVVIASLNLVVDFDFIEQGAENRAPKYMEWYGAFGLMVTLIWLYLEILRLLAKLSNR